MGRAGFDDAALRDPVDPSAARTEARERSAEEGRIGERRGRLAWAVFQSLVLVVGFGLLGSLVVVVVQTAFGGWGADIWTFVIGALMVTPLAIVRVRGVRDSYRQDWVAQYRLRRFARANGLEYSSFLAQPDRPVSMIRRYRQSGAATHVLTGTAPRGFEAANYSYDSGTGRLRMPREATYVTFPVEAALPEVIVIDRRIAPVSVPGNDERVVELGEGPGRVEVWCRPAAEQAVRELLGPDLRDALSALGSAGVEILDGRVSFLVGRAVPVDSPAFWEWVGDLSELVDLIDRPKDVDPSAFAAATARGKDTGSRRRREALFAAPKEARTLLTGCLVPVLLGIVAAALLTSAGISG